MKFGQQVSLSVNLSLLVSLSVNLGSAGHPLRESWSVGQPLGESLVSEQPLSESRFDPTLVERPLLQVFATDLSEVDRPLESSES